MEHVFLAEQPLKATFYLQLSWRNREGKMEYFRVIETALSCMLQTIYRDFSGGIRIISCFGLLADFTWYFTCLKCIAQYFKLWWRKYKKIMEFEQGWGSTQRNERCVKCPLQCLSQERPCISCSHKAISVSSEGSPVILGHPGCCLDENIGTTGIPTQCPQMPAQKL